jgi:hypothetical protein
MNYNKYVRILNPVFMEDDMGGGKFLYEKQKTVRCAVAPSTRTVIGASGREILFDTLKVFMREPVEIDNPVFEYDGELYKLYSCVDYGKVSMYELEAMDNVNR